MKISVQKIRAHLWQWRIRSHRRIVFGGYCRTKRAALSDASIILATHIARPGFGSFYE